MIPRQDEDEEPEVEERVTETASRRRPGLLRRAAGRALRAAARAADRRRARRSRR